MSFLSFPRSIYWRASLPSNICFWHFPPKLNGRSCRTCPLLHACSANMGEFCGLLLQTAGSQVYSACSCLFLCRVDLTIRELFTDFHLILVFFSSTVSECHWYSDWDFIDAIDCFELTGHFLNINSAIHDHECSFCLPVFLQFPHALTFSSCRTFTSSAKRIYADFNLI